MKMVIEKILVGDDIGGDRMSVKLVFTKAQIDSMDNYRELIQKTLEMPLRYYDLIITDLNYTPYGKEGYKVLEAVKGMSNLLVLRTADAHNEEVKRKAMELGATHVLSKSDDELRKFRDKYIV